MLRILRILLSLLLGGLSLHTAVAQEFLADASLKLTEVATNPQYGFEPTYDNSIKVGADENIVSYLRALRGPRGEKVAFSRIGSCCGYEVPGSPGKVAALARWSVMHAGLERPITLYLNKNIYDNPRCPLGFTFTTPTTVVMPRLFPADSLRRVQPCAGKPYAVNDPLLKASVGLNALQPDSLPRFNGGPDPLIAYFATHPISSPDAQRMVFRAHIAFLVNCKGQAGNAQIISQGKGELATFANEVLAVVNRMPQNWVAAKRGRKQVDCWQVLSFTVIGGRLDKVSYR